MKKRFSYIKRFSFLLIAILLLSSCETTQLVTDKVIYRSLRTSYAQPSESNPIPEKAKIIACYKITEEGLFQVTVINNTDEIMIIDNTKSYFISGGKSVSYYDPTVKTTSETDLSSATKGASVNLGAIGSALGIGGGLGRALSGINVGGSGTSGNAVTNTTYITDQPQTSIGPHGSAQMSHVYPIAGFDNYNLVTKTDYNEKNSVLKFSACISYSLDDGKSFQKLVTNFHSNAVCAIPITDNKLNNSLRQVITTKPDAFAEDWWMMKINCNIEESNNVYDKCSNEGVLYDFQ